MSLRVYPPPPHPTIYPSIPYPYDHIYLSLSHQLIESITHCLESVAIVPLECGGHGGQLDGIGDGLVSTESDGLLGEGQVGDDEG